MPDLATIFNTAWNNFEQTGCFQLADTALTLNQLNKIQRYIKKNPPPLADNIAHYQFYLSNVKLIPNSTQDQILTGSITEHSIGHKSGHFVDLHIVQLGTNRHDSITLQPTARENNLTRQQGVFEETLLNLLSQKNAWNAIKLDNVIFEDRSSCLSQGFYNHLLKNLTAHPEVLKDFSVTLPSSFIDQNVLTQFFAMNTGLENLKLAFSEVDSINWPALGFALESHPHLKYISFGDTRLNAAAYHTLSELLHKNYHIEQIELAEPSHEALMIPHRVLVERLLKSCEERFKEEQVTQAKLIKMATQALAKGDTECFALLLNQQSGPLAITAEAWLEKACQNLPALYRNHANHVQQYASDFRLDLQKPLTEGHSKTVGYDLLEKAFAENDSKSIICLIDAGANLLEHTEDANTLIRQLFEGEKSPWKTKVVEYLQKDLTLLVPAVAQLTPFVEVHGHLNEIKLHLDRYLTKLMQRASWPSFLRLITGVAFHFRDRKVEWERALENLVDGIEASADKKPEIDYAAMDTLHQWIKRLLHDARDAKRSWLGRSELNNELERLGTELETKVDACKTALHEKEVTHAQARSQEQPEKIKQLEGELSSQKQERAEDKAEFDEKLKAQQEEIKQLRELMQRYVLQTTSNQSTATKEEISNSEEKNVRTFFKP